MNSAMIFMGSITLMGIVGHEYATLHLIFDVSVFLMSSLIALLLWDAASRSQQSHHRLLALVFGVTTLCELIHVLAAVASPMRTDQTNLLSEAMHPGTWGLSAHLLPIGILGMFGWGKEVTRRQFWFFSFGLFLAGVTLSLLFQWLPRYTHPGLLGITRPTLILAPLLWAAVGVICWRRKPLDMVIQGLGWLSIPYLLAQIFMVYSNHPHDPMAIMAHLGKILGCLFLLIKLGQMGAENLAQRIQTMRDLQQKHQESQQRELQRAMELETTNAALKQEIAARQEAEEQLKASLVELSHFKTALDEHAIVAITDPQGKINYVNDKFCSISKYSRNELLGQDHRIINSGYHPKEFFRNLWSTIARGKVWRGEIRNRAKDGTLYWVDTTIVPFLNAEGKPVQFMAIRADITERKLAEQKLEVQLARLDLLNRITRAIGERQDLPSIFQVVIRSLEDHLPIDFGCVCLYGEKEDYLTLASVSVRNEGLAADLVTKVNESPLDIEENGLTRSLMGQLSYEPDISRLSFPLAQHLAQGGMGSMVVAPLWVESKAFGILVAARQQVYSFNSAECEFLKQLSEQVALAAHQTQLYEALQEAYDDLQETQQAVMQQERLRALGQMASGIAHDINNAISPIALYTESLLESEPNLSPRARNYLETIDRAIDDVAATVARMREFYRQREPQLTLTPLRLNHLVHQVIDLTRARWNDMPQQRGTMIQMRTDLDPQLPAVMGVESEVREALINLIFNGVDAMPEGGWLTIRTRVVEGRLGQTPLQSPNRVIVEVADTGVGMDENTRRRCMEPFFTTKGERGTGLGLAMVYGVAQRHSADIEIESEVGQGTTVQLSFIAPTATPAPGTALSAGLTLPPRMRILVVDDDPLLLKSLRDSLESDGHVVVAAHGGQDGINAFRAAHERLDGFGVVITDLGMPYVDGRKVASAIKELSPSTPVILLTGWGQRLVSEGDIPPHVDRVLNKPPKLRDLREALIQSCSTVNPEPSQQNG